MWVGKVVRIESWNALALERRKSDAPVSQCLVPVFLVDGELEKFWESPEICALRTESENATLSTLLPMGRQ